MATLIVPNTTNFSAVALNNIDVIDFTNPIVTSATATFANTQFNGSSILNTVLFDGSVGTNSVVVNGGSVNASSWTFSSTIESITLNGGAGVDTIQGSTISETINGLGGNDLIIGSLGSDTLNGGLDIDTLSYVNSNSAVTVNLATNTASGGHAQGDVISNFENVTGSAHNDTLTGNDFDNVLVGGGGADTLSGGNGQDTFEYTAGSQIAAGESINGGGGTNTLLINGTGNFNFTNIAISSVSRLTFSASQSTVTLDSADINAIAALTGNTAIDTVNSTGSAINLSGITSFINWTAGVDIINLFGTAGVDTITGTSQDDRITGGAGADILNAGSGNNTFFINAASELVAGESISAQASAGSVNRITMAGAGLFDFTSVALSGVDILDFSAAGSTVTLNGNQIGSTTALVSVFNGSSAADALIVNGLADFASATFNNWTSGIDTITINGTAGDDVIIQGSSQDDIINAGLGNDNMQGNAGNDILNGGAGNNTYFGGFGNDTINGGGDIDTATGQAGTDTLNGGGGADSLSGGDDNDVLNGGAGADSLFGENGNDDFLFTTGSDIVAGEIINGTGNVPDTDRIVIGGGGAFDFSVASVSAVEQLVFGASAATVTLSNAQLAIGQIATIQGSAAANALVVNGSFVDLRNPTFSNWTAGVDTVTVNGTSGIDVVFGSSQIDAINTGEGNDAIVMGLGADVVNGEGGDDSFEFSLDVPISNGLTINGGSGTDDRIQIGAFGGTFDLRNVNFSGVERFAFGTLSTVLMNASVFGPAGVTTITTSNQADILSISGSSIDLTAVTSQAFGAGDVLTLNGTGGADIIRTFTTVVNSNELMTSILNGFGGDDQLIASPNQSFNNGVIDTLNGGDGNDLLIGGANADILNGGADNDTASYINSLGSVIVNMQTGVHVGQAFGDQLNSIENLQGSNFGDTLTGDSLANVLRGEAGNDTLSGGAGADVLNGGADIDTVSYANASGAVSVFLTGGFANEGGGVFDTLIGIENAIGSNFDDTFEGTAAANIIDGSGGIDTLFYLASVGGVTVNLASNTGAGGDAAGDTYLSIENVIGSDTGNDVLTGTNINNFFNGNGGNDTLDGQGGGDSLFGGDGDDLIRPGAGFDFVVGGNNNDTADYSTSAVGVGVHLFFGGGFAGDAIGDGIVGIENVIGSAIGADTLFGDNADNALFGRGGDDIFHGSAGADVMNGEADTDTAFYFASTASISISLAGGTGTGGDAQGDTLISIENLIGSNAAIGVVNGGDTLTGNDVSNFINGFGGEDTINGGLGNDSLFGGSNADSFVFSQAAFGFDAIGDWEDGFDKIHLTSAVANSMAELTLLQVTPNSWFVTIGTAGITVNGAVAFTLDAGDFLFV